MSRSLDMTTVAEGVEARVQEDMLKRLGCDYIQGYYFAKPIPDIMLGIRIIFCLFLFALSSACERPDSAEPVDVLTQSPSPKAEPR